MITEIYIEALLVYKDLADQVWEKWDAGLINDDCVRIAWWLVVNHARNGLFWSTGKTENLTSQVAKEWGQFIIQAAAGMQIV